MVYKKLCKAPSLPDTNNPLGFLTQLPVRPYSALCSHHGTGSGDNDNTYNSARPNTEHYKVSQ